jgi:hypothetical protein
MNDYSDIIFLMGAILLFSILSLQVNRSLLINNIASDTAEIDYLAVSAAQEVIDDVRSITSEADLVSFADNYPMVVNYSTNSQSASSVPLNVDVNVTSGVFDNGHITSFQVTVEVSSVYMTTGEDGRPIILSISKSFN